MTAEAAHLRYQRQVALPGVGADGQSRLARAHAAVIGCGALGCTAADLLARAGVGTITIIDRDLVELSNLQRQPLFDERDAAEALPKAEAARRRLAAVNSSICVVPIVADLHARNAERLLGLNSPSQREGAGGWVRSSLPSSLRTPPRPHSPTPRRPPSGASRSPDAGPRGTTR